MNPHYPQAPVVGVGVIVQKDNSVLLVKRAYEPRKGLWSIPGGKVKLGESIRQAAVREVQEECSITVNINDIISVVDLIDRDEHGKIKYHFVVIDFLAQYIDGELQSASDALEAAWVSIDKLDEYHIPELTRKVIQKAF